MSTNYVPETHDRSSSGRPRRRSRSGKGGSTRSGGSRSGDARSSSRREQGPRKSPPKKLTLIEKVLAFLGLGPKPATRTSPSSRTRTKTESAGTETTRSTPRTKEREPRRTGMRTPEVVEVTTPRLYVGNLSFDATESDVFELFKGAGMVANVEIVSNRQTHRSKGFGFVQMQTVEEARHAASTLHDREFMGRKLVVSGAKASDRRDERVRENGDSAEEEPTQPSE